MRRRTEEKGAVMMTHKDPRDSTSMTHSRYMEFKQGDETVGVINATFDLTGCRPDLRHHAVYHLSRAVVWYGDFRSREVKEAEYAEEDARLSPEEEELKELCGRRGRLSPWWKFWASS